MDKKRFRRLLKESGKTLYRVAAETKIHYNTLLRYRNGQKVSIHKDHVRPLCKAFGVDANALFGIGKPGTYIE